MVSEETDQSALSDSAPAAFRSAKEEHAVMAAVVVLAERLGARVFGTGMQMLSCIRLVLEHEQPGEELVAGDGGEGDGERGRFGGASGHGYVDAFTRVSRVEQHDADGVEEADSDMGAGGRLGSGSGSEAGAGAGAESEEGDLGGGDTLCSVVLALLTTILELGEETRTAEEEEELRAMLGPLKVPTSRATCVLLVGRVVLSVGCFPSSRHSRDVRPKVNDNGSHFFLAVYMGTPTPPFNISRRTLSSCGVFTVFRPRARCCLPACLCACLYVCLPVCLPSPHCGLAPLADNDKMWATEARRRTRRCRGCGNVRSSLRVHSQPRLNARAAAAGKGTRRGRRRPRPGGGGGSEGSAHGADAVGAGRGRGGLAE